MAYSNKLKDFNELLNCVDYAMINDIAKDKISAVVDGLVDHYAKLRNGSSQMQLVPIMNIIDDSGLSSDQLDMQCDCDDVTLYDVLEEFSSLTYNTLDGLSSYLKLI
jgi:hypothetical protein